MSSSRFPGKVLKPIMGIPMLLLQAERVRSCRMIDKVVVVTSTGDDDRQIADLCSTRGIEVFCGSLENVLERFYRAAQAFRPDHIVRITGDCPLIDPAVVDAMIELYLRERAGYGSNCLPPTYPDGLDAEIFSYSSLEQAWQEAVLPSHLEHISPFFESQPGRFRPANLSCSRDLSSLRWTVDEPDDFELVRRIFEALYPAKPLFSMQDVLDLLAQHPGWSQLNSGCTRNEGLAGAVHKDRDFLRVFFKVRADAESGLGHLFRCRSLMAGLARQAECAFTFAVADPALVRRCIDAKITVVPENAAAGEQDIAVLDAPENALASFSAFAVDAAVRVCVADEGPGVPWQDVLIRPNLLDLEPPPSAGAQLTYLSGKQYIILHPDFIPAAAQSRSRTAPVRRIVACFGGSDPAGLSVRVVPLLRQLGPDIHTTIVIGAACSRAEEVASLAGPDRRVSIEHNAASLLPLFCEADLALISGGTLLYEACCLGVPALVLSQNRAQQDEAAICARSGAVVDLGIHDRVSDVTISAELSGICQRGEAAGKRRTGMSRAAQTLIPADGAMRIAGLLLSLAGKGCRQ